MLEKVGSVLHTAIKKLKSVSSVDVNVVDELIKDIQRALIIGDVDIKLIQRISKHIHNEAFREDLPSGLNRRQHIISILWEELTKIIGGQAKKLDISEKPGSTSVLMMIGIQGSGKTTTTVKLAKYLTTRGFTTGLVCADTFRPGALAQLRQLVERDEVNTEVYGDERQKNAVKVSRDGIQYFMNQKKPKRVIIVDTAGRHASDEDLLDEMKQIAKKIPTREIILVIDGTIGQAAERQAAKFKEAIQEVKGRDIGSIIVTKLDGSGKGGGALSAVAATGAPIKFIGAGERANDLESFDPEKFVGELLGIQDLESLLKKVKRTKMMSDPDRLSAMMQGRFSLEDMYEQIKSMRKMGPLSRIFGMFGGGLKYNLPGQEDLEDIADSTMKQWRAILDSMTAEEKFNPMKIKRSRRERIARGSGTLPIDVAKLIKYCKNAKELIKNNSRRRNLCKHNCHSIF